MSFKEYLLHQVQVFFVLVTLIFAASTIVGMINAPDQPLKYEQLAGPFIIAALCVIPSFITYFKNEPTLPQYIIRNVIQLAVIEVLVLLIMNSPTGENRVTFYLSIGIIVFIIFVIVKFMMWLQKYVQSKKLTAMLKKMQSESL